MAKAKAKAKGPKAVKTEEPVVKKGDPTYQGGKKATVYAVSVTPKAEGSKILMNKRIVLADDEKEAREKAGVSALLARHNLQPKEVWVKVEEVTDIK
ncbi:MAG: hypothetical protein WC565_08055 [Parcubacteria group bacterium]